MPTGVKYTLTGDTDRGTIQGYHRKPSPLMLNKCLQSDVAGLPKKVVSSIVKIDGNGIESKFTVGMEVEKNQLHRNAVREYELFCGFESDNSCGYEAVTHILPLLPAGTWRNKVYDMMHKAERIIDDQFSPSDSACGGHITLGVNGLDGITINELVRKYSGIILAMYRFRMNNKYCGHNQRMEVDVPQRWGGPTHRYRSCSYSYPADNRGWQHKYQLALVKGNLLEFRIPSKFESVKQMMRRYELFYELLNYAVNVKGSYANFLKKITPLVKIIYPSTDASDHILKLAVHFQTFINTGKVHEDIAKWAAR